MARCICKEELYYAALVRTESAATAGSMRMPGPIVDDVVIDLMYRPLDAAGLVRRISSRTAWKFSSRFQTLMR